MLSYVKLGYIKIIKNAKLFLSFKPYLLFYCERSLLAKKGLRKKMKKVSFALHSKNYYIVSDIFNSQVEDNFNTFSFLTIFMVKMQVYVKVICKS